MLKLATTLLLAASQVVITGGSRHLGSGSGGGGVSCASPTPPTMTRRWLPSAATCDAAGDPCTNGQTLYYAHDVVTGLNATPQNITYVASSGFNGQPAYQFTAAGHSEIDLQTNISQSTAAYTIYATLTGESAPIIGGNPGALEWRVQSSQEQVLRGQVALLGSGTATINAGTKYTLLLNVDTTAGSYAFFICSGGTCHSDGSSTFAPGLFTSDITVLGSAEGIYADRQIAEIGFYNGISSATNTAIGAWSYCHYGI